MGGGGVGGGGVGGGGEGGGGNGGGGAVGGGTNGGGGDGAGGQDAATFDVPPNKKLAPPPLPLDTLSVRAKEAVFSNMKVTALARCSSLIVIGSEGLSPLTAAIVDENVLPLTATVVGLVRA